MIDYAEYGAQMRACPGIWQACRENQDLLAQRARRHPDEPLDYWLTALQSLEAEAAMLLQYWSMGLAHPALLRRLLEQTPLLLQRLGQFLGGGDTPDPEHSREAKRMEARLTPVPIGEHRMPPLPYAYDALEPHIDEQTMRVHHDRHHRAYVEGLNRAEREMAQARVNGNFDLIRHWEREAAFHGAGHYLHTVFWQTMSPQGGGAPTGDLAAAIAQSFGSTGGFTRHLSQAAEKVEAVGWAILVWAPRAQRLEVLQAEKHQNLSQWDVIPLLPLDVWEHAYYLKHQNDRAAYIRNWWNVVKWPEVARRFTVARQVRWEPF